MSDVEIPETIAALEAAGIREEALGVVVPARFMRGETIKSAGKAWRLGMLLLDRNGQLYEVGEVTRAVEPLRGVANKSPDAETRREKRRAAVRGRFAEGTAVNFGFRAIDPPGTVNGMPLGDYLADRLSLVISPP